jgi:hypothetical protein
VNAVIGIAIAWAVLRILAWVVLAECPRHVQKASMMTRKCQRSWWHRGEHRATTEQGAGIAWGRECDGHWYWQRR